MRTPSIKSLKERLNISEQAAKQIKKSMEQDQNPTKTLNLANYFMKGYGVEDLYPEYPEFQYVNMGDTYSTTLYFTGGKYFIGSWGDFVEQHDSELSE